MQHMKLQLQIRLRSKVTPCWSWLPPDPTSETRFTGTSGIKLQIATIPFLPLICLQAWFLRRLQPAAVGIGGERRGGWRRRRPPFLGRLCSVIKSQRREPGGERLGHNWPIREPFHPAANDMC